jgi:peptidoglycan/xylan/chitin deacetylase (PgdA/CDA1 family)
MGLQGRGEGGYNPPLMTPVLYYHRVGPFRAGAPQKMTVTPENFKSQMHFLRRNKIDVLTLDEVLAGSPGVALTFDDGFKDCMEFALPTLEALHFPATFFIVAGAVGGTDAWMRVTPMPEERIMDWDDLQRLLEARMTIGSHSMTHTTLTEVEVGESRRVLEGRLGIKVDHFAYPRGERPPGADGWVKAAGYKAAWATKSGDDGAFTRRRLPISANASLADFGARLLKARLGYY